MLALLWLIPAFPFAGFVALGLLGRRLRRSTVATVGVGSVGLSTLFAALVTASFVLSPPRAESYTQTLWSWINIGSFTPAISFNLDALSLIMMLVVAFVSFCIHLYSAEFMANEEGYSRFFAYMNLFVGSMLTLVLADNLLLLYLGWEGVGLCSYLLIGFWYKDPANGAAARKAFIVTRVGDAAMMVGLFLIFTKLGTLQIQQLLEKATQHWPIGSPLAITASALLLAGAVGKSAQLPLQTWLPDAMAGPTPVSALIHAATMVTAGVYLIARTHVLFSLAPPVLLAVAIIGALTMLLAGFSGLTQRDIKRVLAYSTISQIGYMFLALGVGAWSAAIFHFMSHAFFKSLLFLAAGVVIQALHEEHDMFNMGGLRKILPLAFWPFFIGALALAGLPPTDGFSSKSLILAETWSSGISNRWLWWAGLCGVALTSIYTFRMLFLTFFGPRKHRIDKRPGHCVSVPLVVLAILTVLVAGLNWPRSLGGSPVLTNFLRSALPAPPVKQAGAGETWLEIITVCVSLLGVLVAWLVTINEKNVVRQLVRAAPAAVLHRFWFAGWGFDWLYQRLFVRPFVWIAQTNKSDFFAFFDQTIASLTKACHGLLKLTQAGNIRWYATGLAIGAILIVSLILFL